MAKNDPNLRVRISADINDIKQGLALVRGEVAKFKQEAAQAVDLKGMNEGFNNLRSTLAGLFAGVTVGSLFRTVIQETREAGDEVAQLRAVLKSTGEQAGFTSARLLEMADTLADSTTHSAGEIVKAQTRLLSYTGIVGEQFPQALQMAIDQSARLGESIEQSAETIGKALDKPSQGVAALTKQGFKFTEAEKERMKVLEKAGRVGEAQKIVLDAMAESYAGAASAARNTFGGAMTAVGNSLRDLMDGSGGTGMGAATRAINELALALKSPEVRKGFNNLATAVLNAVAGFAKFIAQDGVKYLRLLAEAAAFAVKHIDVLAVAIGTYLAVQGIGAAITGITAMIKGLAALRASLIATEVTAKGLRATFATMGGPITLAIAALSAALYVLYQRTQEAAEAAELHREALRENVAMSKASRDAALEDATAKRKQALETLNAAKAALEERRVRMMDTTSVYARGGDRGDAAALSAANNVTRARVEVDRAQKEFDDWGRRLVELSMEITEEVLAGSGSVAEAAATATGKALAKSNALLLDSATRLLAELDRQYADSAIGIDEYYGRRLAIQQRLIDLQVEQARSELAIATDLGQRRTLEEQIIKLQRDRAEAGVAGARDQQQASEDLAKKIGDVHLRLMELDGRTGDVERANLETEYLDLFKKLDANSDATGRKMVENLIDRLVAKAKGDELKRAGDDIASALQGKETSVGAQVAGGMLGYSEGERQIAAARAKALTDLRALRAASVAALADMKEGTPEHAAVLAGIGAIDVQIANITASQEVFKQKMEAIAESSFGDFLADLTTGAKSFKEAFADMVKSFVAGVAKMVAQEIALRAIKAAFSAWGGNGAAVGASVAQQHTGGMAGQSAVRVRVNPMLFGQAPRYHSGGIAGLAPDEVPAILQTGERVLSRRQTAMYDATLAAGANAGRVTTPIVAIGDDAVANAMASAAGEDVVVTIVRNNWEGLQRGSD